MRYDYYIGSGVTSLAASANGTPATQADYTNQTKNPIFLTHLVADGLRGIGQPFGLFRDVEVQIKAPWWQAGITGYNRGVDLETLLDYLSKVYEFPEPLGPFAPGQGLKLFFGNLVTVARSVAIGFRGFRVVGEPTPPPTRRFPNILTGERLVLSNASPTMFRVADLKADSGLPFYAAALAVDEITENLGDLDVQMEAPGLLPVFQDAMPLLQVMDHATRKIKFRHPYGPISPGDVITVTLTNQSTGTVSRTAKVAIHGYNDAGEG